MLDTLASLFKTEHLLGRLQDVFYSTEKIIGTFQEDYLKDKNAKNAAIDCVIHLLQQQKDPENG